LVAEINRSEWTPPLHFELDLASARYDLRLPPDRKWHFVVPAPPPRAGTLGEPLMQTIRRLVSTIVAEGFSDESCEKNLRDAEREGAVIMNFGGPFVMSLHLPEGQLTASSRCPSAPAVRLERLLDSLFPAHTDRRSDR
jgi:hypothetical protein